MFQSILLFGQLKHPARRSARRWSRDLVSALEQLEPRQMLDASTNDIAPFSDEFDNAASINQWSEVHATEGWGARGAQFNQWTVNANGSGQMLMQPHSVVWYEDWRGPLVFKEITGDFVITTKMQVTDRDNLGGSDADNVPGDSLFSLGGLMIRTPRAITNGAADWVPGSRSASGNVGENYIFLSMGYTTGDNRFSFEVKTTRNSVSNLEVAPIGLQPNEVELRIARIGSAVIVLERLDGEADWTVHRRYSRPDMPQTLQVGMVTYSDWEKANDFAPIVHNASVLARGQIADPSPDQPFNPDLTASFDYTRFARPQVPAELAGVNLVTTATDAQLLSFLGDGGDANPDPPTRTRIGMNLSGAVDWDPAWIFRDAFQRARPWGAIAYNPATGDSGWQFSTGEGPAINVDEHGWVTSLPTWTHSNGTVYQQQATTVIFTDEARQPAGIYRAEWEGNGDLAMPFVTESGTLPDGRHYALVNMPHGAHFTMTLRSTDSANPVRNIRLWMPDFNGQSLVGGWQPGDNGTPFHPLFLDRLDEFDTLRFMDLMNTNHTDIVTWADRSRLGDASQSDGDLPDYFHTHGLAPEYLVELSNETDANPWFNMPHQASDDYVRQLATLVRDTLDTDLKIYVEWSNELWNGFFPTYHWLVAQTQLPENAGLDFFQIAGREMRRDFDIWTDVFAGQEDRLIRVVAGQQANSWLVEQLLANVGGRVDAVSCTAYSGIGSEMTNLYSSTTTANDIINDLLNVSIPWASARLQEHEAVVEDYEALLGRDLEFVTYESGSHIMSDPNPFFRWEGQPQHPALNAAIEAMNSPRMYDVYQTLLTAVNDAGVDLYNEFTFTSHSAVRHYGTYGVLHDMTPPLSQAHKLRSLLDYIAAHPDDDTNSPPVLAAIGNRTLNELATLNFTASATDADLPAQTLTYSLIGAPAGASITPSGVFRWTPTEAQGSGNYTFDVVVSDGSLTDSERITVTVNEVNVAPVLGTIGNRTVNALTTLSFTATATDADLPTQSLPYSLIGAPAGASITSTGVFSWTPTAAQAPGTYQMTVRVTDNGSPAMSDDETFSITVLDLPRLSISDATVTEGDTGSITSLFVVTLSAPSTRTVSVNYATASNTATSGADFQSRSGTLTFAPGVTRQTINVPVLGDRRDEADETFFLRLTNAVDAIFGDSEGLGTIIDNDPLPQLSANRISVTERDADSVVATLTVRLSAASGREVTVNYTTANGTATAGNDYDAVSGTLTFAPGETSKSVPVTTRGDLLDEVNETVAFNLSGATNATVSATQGQVTITDNDPTPVMSITNASIQEGSSGNRELVFTINLSAESGRSVTVRYSTANGTARAVTDYVAASGTLTFAPGVTSQTIRITVFGDSLRESDETFSVRLSSAVGATLGTSSGSGTILNDD